MKHKWPAILVVALAIPRLSFAQNAALYSNITDTLDAVGVDSGDYYNSQFPQTNYVGSGQDMWQNFNTGPVGGSVSIDSVSFVGGFGALGSQGLTLTQAASDMSVVIRDGTGSNSNVLGSQSGATYSSGDGILNFTLNAPITIASNSSIWIGLIFPASTQFGAQFVFGVTHDPANVSPYLSLVGNSTYLAYTSPYDPSINPYVWDTYSYQHALSEIDGTPIPEPSTWALLAGLAALAAAVGARLRGRMAA